MPLKRVIELTGGTIDRASTDMLGTPVMTGGDIGLSTYPIFQEDYRAKLNGRIIDHFWNQEIGLETIDMFQLAMTRKMFEIMPVYNKMYAELDYPALSTMDINTTADAEATQHNTSSGSNDTNVTAGAGARSVTSDTPQTRLAGNADYATGANDSTNSSHADTTVSEDGTSDSDSTQNTNSHVTGYEGLAADLIMRYRQSLMNIDLLIINELQADCLFMAVWDNGDEYTPNYRRF